MAAHQLSIAKATFTASLLRPDVTKVNRDDALQFHASLENALRRCTPSNIQTCKQWLLDNIISSTHRTNAFTKYMLVLARSQNAVDNEPRSRPQRMSLHAIYLLHDVLHHLKHHLRDQNQHRDFSQACQSVVIEGFQSATVDNKKRIRTRLHQLMTIWKDDDVVGEDVLEQLETILSKRTRDRGGEKTVHDPTPVSSSKEAPFLMPATHGDPSLPFHELPAGNYMPHILPNRTVPMRSDSIKPLRFAPGPADVSLVNAVKDLLKDIDSIDNVYQHLDDEGIVPDIDDLGQLSYRNEAGDVIGDTYYGWSRAFCDKMKARRKGDELDGDSRSRSSSSRKRRRLDGSSRSSSMSSLPARPAFKDRPQAFAQRSRSRSRSPPPSFAPSHKQPQTIAPPPFVPVQDLHQLPLPPPPLGPDGLPIPPPRPPNWNGPWPPPPPPPPFAGRGTPARGYGYR